MRRAPYSPDVLALNPELTALPRPAKFGNVRTPTDAGIADSQAEARRWQQLRLLEVAGQIRNLVFHPVYALPGGVGYEADSQYEELTATGEWALVTEDVKGAETAVFKNKAKQFRAQYPQELRIIPARSV